MSWDVLIQRFSRRYAELSEIPADEKGAPLGPRSAVHAAVSAVFGRVDWSNPGWGRWESAFGSIDFNVGSDPARSLMLHVRARPDTGSAASTGGAVAVPRSEPPSTR